MSVSVILVLSSEVAGIVSRIADLGGGIASHGVAMADSHWRLRGRGDVSHGVAVVDSH